MLPIRILVAQPKNFQIEKFWNWSYLLSFNHFNSSFDRTLGH
jgi:hypothetical protein